MMEHAIKYAQSGLPVFPIWEPIAPGVCSCSHGAAELMPDGRKHSKGKHPRTPNGCSDATTDLAQIKEWWTKWPNANIGVRTGDGVGVVDLDGLVGIESGRQMNLFSPVKTITGNGEQLWYLVPEGQKLVTRQAKKLAPGVDTRGTGGYVLVPPSLHPNGKRYLWAGSPISKDLLPPLPTIFIEQKKLLPGLVKRNTAGFVAEAIKEMQNGHVHNTLIRVLGKFRHHNFTEEDTFALLHPHALVDGKPFEGLKAKIAEIWQRYPAGQAPLSSITYETAEKFLEATKPPEWLCEPFVTKKSIGFVCGLPETLKTWLCMDFAVEFARGDGMWAGLFPMDTGKVWFIEQERTKDDTQTRFNSVLAAKGLTKADMGDKLVMSAGTTIRLNMDNSFQAFKTALLEMMPTVVIIDSFKTFHTAPENDSTEIQKVIERLKILRDEVGCAFLFIHHENKMAYPNGEPQGEPNMGTISGSGAITAAAEFCMVVRKMEEHTSMVWHVKGTSAKKKAKPFYASVVDTDNGGVSVRGLNG